MKIIISIVGLVLIRLAHANPCDPSLAPAQTFAIRNPTEAVKAYIAATRPGARVGASFGVPTESGWSITIQFDHGAIGTRTETFEVLENDDNTCTVRASWAQG